MQAAVERLRAGRAENAAQTETTEEELAQAQSLFPAAECGYDGKSITLQYEEAEE